MGLEERKTGGKCVYNQRKRVERLASWRTMKNADLSSTGFHRRVCLVFDV